MIRRASVLCALAALLALGLQVGAGHAEDRAIRARSGESEPAPARTRSGPRVRAAPRAGPTPGGSSAGSGRPAAGPAGSGATGTGAGGSGAGGTLVPATSTGGGGAAGPTSLAGPSPANAPALDGVAPSCLSTGEPLTVSGRRLGSASLYALVLSGAGAPRTLSTSVWSTTQIVAAVPEVEPGRAYLLHLKHGARVVGNRLTVPACTAPPATRQPAGGPSAAPAPAQPAPQPPEEPPITRAGIDVASEVLVAVSGEDAAREVPARASRALGLTRVEVLRERSLDALDTVLVVLGLPPGLEPKAAAGRLRAVGLVADANDTYAPAADAERVWGRQQVGLAETDAGCGAGLRLGLVDTGVDVAHPMLAGRAVRSRAFHGEGRAASTEHGTAIAALLVGSGDVAGLLPAATLHVAAAFRATGATGAAGAGSEADVEAIARGLDWLVAEQVAAVNLSLAGPPNRVLAHVLDRGVARRVPVAAAAGNEGPGAPPAFPASHPGIVAVTAVDAGLRAYRRANRGDYLDLAAPGVDVWTAAGANGGKFASGTSYATPFVTAALALAAAAEPGAPAERLRQTLLASSRDLGARGDDPVFGHGLVQLPACGAAQP